MQYLNQNIKLSNYVSICTDVKSKPARGVLPQGGRFDPLERSPYLSCNFNLPFPWQDYLQMISILSFLVFLKPIKCYLHVKGQVPKIHPFWSRHPSLWVKIMMMKLMIIMWLKWQVYLWFVKLYERLLKPHFFAIYCGFSTFFVCLLSEIINKVVVAPHYFRTTLPQFWHIISQNFFHLSLMMFGTIIDGPQKDYQTCESMHISIFLWAYFFWRISFCPTKFLCTYLYLVHISPWQIWRHQIIGCAKNYFVHICSRQFWGHQMISCAKICLVHMYLLFAILSHHIIFGAYNHFVHIPSWQFWSHQIISCAKVVIGRPCSWVKANKPDVYHEYQM